MVLETNLQIGMLLVTTIITYLYLFDHRVRWVRIIGCTGIMMLGLFAGYISNDIIMYVFFGMNFIIATIKLIDEIVALTSLDKQ